MHMADALVSPAVGGAGWVVAAGLTAYSVRKLHKDPAGAHPALMGVLGAFVFAAQMVNFTIPATGSSGHIGGGVILSALLGPHAAFLTLTSVLVVQALLFADGGLLALGCNIANLGLFTCFVAYPLLFRPLAGTAPSQRRLTLAAVVAAIVGLLLGASAVVLETTSSQISQLPFGTFVLFMLPIHLAIGIVEGLLTAGVLLYVWKARPELVRVMEGSPLRGHSVRALLVTFAVATVVVGGALSWFASTRPDGLEWSMGKTAHTEALEGPSAGIHATSAKLQQKTALLPDYALDAGVAAKGTETESSWPAPKVGTSFSGLLGAALTLLLAFGAGLGLHLLRSRNKAGAN
jgi:cobalt/nickel transport system permease protein